MATSFKALMFYLEPTPYVWGLVEAIRSKTRKEDVTVVFAGANLTQSWGLQIAAADAEILPTGFLPAVRRLRQLIWSGNFEVVHLAGWGHPLLLVCIFFAWLCKVPSVLESDTPTPPSLAGWKRLVKKAVYPCLFRLPAHFLPGGRRQAQYLKDYGVAPDKISIARMTVDTESISRHVDSLSTTRKEEIRRTIGIPAHAVIILFVGRLEPFKGIRTLLHAFVNMQPSNQSIHLLIVGDGTLRSEVKSAAMAASIHATGRLAGSHLLDIYGIADILVVPSLFEPWGLVVNEGMAAGLPLVMSNRVGCCDDLVIDGETGILVPANDDVSLSKALHKLATNSHLRKGMSQSARHLIADWTLANEAETVIRAWEIVKGSTACTV